MGICAVDTTPGSACCQWHFLATGDATQRQRLRCSISMVISMAKWYGYPATTAQASSSAWAWRAYFTTAPSLACWTSAPMPSAWTWRNTCTGTFFLAQLSLQAIIPVGPHCSATPKSCVHVDCMHGLKLITCLPAIVLASLAAAYCDLL